jgi:hypothetical protein
MVQDLVIVSCRFKIARATAVQAAKSTGSISGGKGASPTANNLPAASRSAA